jgi:hypothetical protein
MDSGLLHQGRAGQGQLDQGQPDQVKIRKGEIMVIEDLEHRFEQLGQRIELVRSYL